MPNWSSRWYAAALTMLFVVGQGLSFAHRLVEQHAICAEHGEVIHVQSGSGEPAEAREVSAAPALDGEGGHAHCLAGATRREDFLAPAFPDVAIAGMHAAGVPGVVAVASPLTGIELLLLAPKSSPPA